MCNNNKKKCFDQFLKDTKTTKYNLFEYFKSDFLKLHNFVLLIGLFKLKYHDYTIL